MNNLDKQIQFLLAVLGEHIEDINIFLCDENFDLTYDNYIAAKHANAQGNPNVIKLFINNDRFDYKFQNDCLLVDALIRDEREIIYVLNSKYNLFPNKDFIYKFEEYSNDILHYVFANFNFLRDSIIFHLEDQNYPEIVKELKQKYLLKTVNDF